MPGRRLYTTTNLQGLGPRWTPIVGHERRLAAPTIRSGIGGPPNKKAARGRPCSSFPVRRGRQNGPVMQGPGACEPGAIPTVDFLLYDLGRAGKFHAVKSHVGASQWAAC